MLLRVFAQLAVNERTGESQPFERTRRRWIIDRIVFAQNRLQRGVAALVLR